MSSWAKSKSQRAKTSGRDQTEAKPNVWDLVLTWWRLRCVNFEKYDTHFVINRWEYCFITLVFLLSLSTHRTLSGHIPWRLSSIGYKIPSTTPVLLDPYCSRTRSQWISTPHTLRSGWHNNGCFALYLCFSLWTHRRMLAGERHANGPDTRTDVCWDFELDSSALDWALTYSHPSSSVREV